MPVSTYYWRCRHPEPAERKALGGRPIPGVTSTRDGRIISDVCVKELLQSAIEGDGFPYGYRKLTYWLRREHKLVINKKKVYRLCKEMGILQIQRRRRPRLRRHRIAMNREVTAVNQVWESDIKYGYIASERRFFFVQVVLDVYDRMVVDYHVGLSCTGADAGATLREAHKRRAGELADNTAVVIRTDNGPQFISRNFDAACTEVRFEHECIPVQTPNKNAHVEAFHSILEDECLGRHEFHSFAEAYVTVVDFIDYYNYRRLHGSLGYRPPSEYHEACMSNTAREAVIKL